MGSLTKHWLVDWDKLAFTSNSLFKAVPKAYIKENDVLLLSASHQLDYIGKNFAIVSNLPAKYIDGIMAVGELIIARANKAFILPEFLLACLTLKHIQKLINRLTRGQSAHLYAEDLKSLQIPVPPLEIQQNIVSDFVQRRMEAQRLLFEAEEAIRNAKVELEILLSGRG